MRTIQTHARDERVRERIPRIAAGKAFTIIEAMVVMGVIALLASMVLMAVGHARKSGDITAERAMVVTLKTGVESFKQKFGFIPPLVIDDPAGGPANAPTNATTAGTVTTGHIYIWSTQDLSDVNTMLNGSTGPNDRRCYSRLSLPFYLAGTCDEIFDGVDGLGFTEPSSNHDGSFSNRGRKYDPLVDPTLQKTRAGVNRLVRNPLVGDATVDQVNRSHNFAILDRWSDGTPANSAPIRYYRWLPAYFSSGANTGQIQYWNVPVAVGGDPNPLNPPSRIELKGAEWAIVSAGPDHLFGDEGGVPNPDAAKDNIVEVGR